MAFPEYPELPSGTVSEEQPAFESGGNSPYCVLPVEYDFDLIGSNDLVWIWKKDYGYPLDYIQKLVQHTKILIEVCCANFCPPCKQVLLGKSDLELCQRGIIIITGGDMSRGDNISVELDYTGKEMVSPFFFTHDATPAKVNRVLYFLGEQIRGRSRLVRIIKDTCRHVKNVESEVEKMGYEAEGVYGSLISALCQLHEIAANTPRAINQKSELAKCMKSIMDIRYEFSQESRDLAKQVGQGLERQQVAFHGRETRASRKRKVTDEEAAVLTVANNVAKKAKQVDGDDEEQDDGMALDPELGGGDEDITGDVSGELEQDADITNGETSAPSATATNAPAVPTGPRHLPFFQSGGFLEGTRVVCGKNVARSTDPSRPIPSACVFGHNGITLARWFPFRVCMRVVGGHREVQSGIHGNSEDGVYAIVVTGGSKALNSDQGEVIWYAGPEARQNKKKNAIMPLSAGSKALRKSIATGNVVRVFRGENRNFRYAPKWGFEYSGLYKVVGERIREKNAESCPYLQFKLEAVAGEYVVTDHGLDRKLTDAEELIKRELHEARSA